MRIDGILENFSIEVLPSLPGTGTLGRCVVVSNNIYFYNGTDWILLFALTEEYSKRLAPIADLSHAGDVAAVAVDGNSWVFQNLRELLLDIVPSHHNAKEYTGYTWQATETPTAGQVGFLNNYYYLNPTSGDASEFRERFRVQSKIQILNDSSGDRVERTGFIEAGYGTTGGIYKFQFDGDRDFTSLGNFANGDPVKIELTGALWIEGGNINPDRLDSTDGTLGNDDKIIGTDGNEFKEDSAKRLIPPGGTSGQFLRKLSNDSYDSAWQTPEVTTGTITPNSITGADLADVERSLLSDDFLLGLNATEDTIYREKVSDFSNRFEPITLREIIINNYTLIRHHTSNTALSKGNIVIDVLPATVVKKIRVYPRDEDIAIFKAVLNDGFEFIITDVSTSNTLRFVTTGAPTNDVGGIPNLELINIQTDSIQGATPAGNGHSLTIGGTINITSKGKFIRNTQLVQNLDNPAVDRIPSTKAVKDELAGIAGTTLPSPTGEAGKTLKVNPQGSEYILVDNILGNLAGGERLFVLGNKTEYAGTNRPMLWYSFNNALSFDQRILPNVAGGELYGFSLVDEDNLYWWNTGAQSSFKHYNRPQSIFYGPDADNYETPTLPSNISWNQVLSVHFVDNNNFYASTIIRSTGPGTPVTDTNLIKGVRNQSGVWTITTVTKPSGIGRAEQFRVLGGWDINNLYLSINKNNIKYVYKTTNGGTSWTLDSQCGTTLATLAASGFARHLVLNDSDSSVNLLKQNEWYKMSAWGSSNKDYQSLISLNTLSKSTDQGTTWELVNKPYIDSYFLRSSTYLNRSNYTLNSAKEWSGLGVIDVSS